METSTYKDILPTRVPEYMQGDTNMGEYLEVCGEVFDDLKGNIEAIDFYKDYKNSAESRLGLLARRFAFNPPGRLEGCTVRNIIRDLTDIYRTNGIKKTVQWIMRILSWDASIEELWLVFPERYQQQVQEQYPSFYTQEGLESFLSRFELFVPRAGQGYRVGIQYQTYADDSNRIVDGYLLVGENNLLPQGSFFRTDPFDVDAGFAEHFDVGRIDMKNFVIGKRISRSSGIYFQGKTQFSSIDNLFDLRILGEQYPVDHIRREQVVMKTPYITIDISSDDYDQFVDDSYSEREKYSIAQRLIQFMLYDLFRPLNIKIINLLTPLDFDDNIGSTETMENIFEFDQDPFVESNPYFYSDAPSYQHFDSITALTIPDAVAHQSTDSYSYSKQISTTLTGGKYVSNEVLHTRSPSEVVVNSSEPFELEYKQYRNSDWVVDGSYSSGETSLKTSAIYEVRLMFDVSPTSCQVNVTWLDQRTDDLQIPILPSIGAI